MSHPERQPHQPKPLHQLGQLIVACEIYLVHQGKVLMHQRAKDKKKFPGFWIGPGGHVDEGEDVLSTAIREVKEEAGVTVKENHVKLKVLAFHHHLDRGEAWCEYLFRGTVSQLQNVSFSREGKSQWVDIQKMLKMKNVFPPSKYYFDHILNDRPGIKYNFSRWRNSKLVKVLSERIDRDF